MTAGDDAAAVVTCARCGDPIDTSEWYPVHGRTDGEYEIYHFCGVPCRRAWRDRHGES